MIRVLHLLGRSPDFQSERSSAALARVADPDFEMTTQSLGHGQTIHNFLASIWAIRKIAGNFDVVHVWDAQSLRAAAYATRLPLVFSPSTTLNKSDSRLLQRSIDAGRLQIACTTEYHRRWFAAAGVPPERCHLIRPIVEIAKSRQVDPELREALGFSPDDLVLLAPGESTRTSGHRQALWTASILHVLNPRIRILFWGRGERLDDLLKLSAKLSQPKLMCVAERRLGRSLEFESLTGAADIGLLTADAGATSLAGMLCVAAGMPIVATDNDPVNEILRGREIRLVAGGSARLLAQEVLEIASNLTGERTLAADAIAHGLECSSPAIFADEYHRLYRKAIQLHKSGIAQLLA